MTRHQYMLGLVDAIERGQASEYRAAHPWPEPSDEPEPMVIIAEPPAPDPEPHQES